jgi:hypothetical protein
VHGQPAVNMREYLHKTKDGGILVKKHEQQALVAECRASGMTKRRVVNQRASSIAGMSLWATRLDRGRAIPQYVDETTTR